MKSISNGPTSQVAAEYLAGVGYTCVQLASPEFGDARRGFANFCRPENLAALRERMEIEGPKENAWQSASHILGISWDEVPAHVNIQVKGELGFLVERRVWQSAIFTTFVRSNINSTFGRGAVVEWCRTTLGRRADFAILQERKHLLPREENKALPWAPRAVRAYLRALVKLGFLASCGGGRYEILRR